MAGAPNLPVPRPELGLHGPLNLEDRVARLEIARRIAQSHGVDAGDVEHVLFNMTLTPIEKLRGAMRRARLRGLAYHRG